MTLFLLRCFRRATKRTAVAATPKVVVGTIPAIVVKSMAAAGGLVCVAVLVWLPVYGAVPWGGWRDQAPSHLVGDYTPPFDLAGLNTGAGLFPVSPSAIPSTSPVTSGPGSSLRPRHGQPSGHAGREPVEVPEPWSLGLFLAGLVWLIAARRIAA